MKEILSVSNPSVKKMVQLNKSSSVRKEEQLFTIEGIRLCEDAVRSGIGIDSLYLTPEALEKHYSRLQPILEFADECYLINDIVAQKISATKASQDIFALCEIPSTPVNFSPQTEDKVLLVDSLQDPGNLGTIIRTAEAMGLRQIFLYGCPDLYSPKVLRASMGGVFRMTFFCQETINSITLLKQHGFSVWASTLSKNSIPLKQGLFSGKTGILLGNEGNGLEQNMIDSCSSSVHIPMLGEAESLNVSAAASILLWELSNQSLGE